MWGVLTVTAEDTPLPFQTLKRVSVATVLIMLWSSFGNAAYSHGTVQYDWFMLTGQCLPFDFSPTVERVLPFVLPCVVFFVVIGVSTVVIGVVRAVQQKKTQRTPAQTPH